MLHVQLFQYACKLHFACSVTCMLLILGLYMPIATMLHVCPDIYALATQIPYLAELIQLFADDQTDVRSDQRLVGHLQMLAGHNTIDPC